MSENGAGPVDLEAITSAFDLVEGEIWTPVPTAGDYIVSTSGDVVSFVRSNPRRLSPIRIGDYEGFQLRHDDGETRKRYAHRLVLHAWMGPPPENHEARHLNGDRSDNRLENLRWGSRSQNHRDKRRHGTDSRGERNPQAKLTAQDVREMRRLYRTGEFTYAQLGERFGVSTMTANRAVRGESWSHVN